MSLTAPRRRAPWAAGLVGAGLALGAGCARSPDQALGFREAWELVGIVSPVGVVDARVSIGNTGLYRNQGTVVLDRFGVDLDPVHFQRRSGPGETLRSADGRRLALADDTLEASQTAAGERRWRLRVRSGEANAIVEVRGQVGAPAATGMAGGGQWSLGPELVDGSLHGWIEAGKRGGRLEGRAVVLRRGGDGLVDGPRTTVAVFCDGLDLGIDRQGPLVSAWATPAAPGAAPASGAVSADLTLAPDGSGHLAVGGHQVDFVATLSRLSTDVHADLNPIERLLIDLRGPLPVRTTAQLRATVTGPGPARSCPGVLVHVAEAPLAAPAPRRRRGER